MSKPGDPAEAAVGGWILHGGRRRADTHIRLAPFAAAVRSPASPEAASAASDVIHSTTECAVARDKNEKKNGKEKKKKKKTLLKW